MGLTFIDGIIIALAVVLLNVILLSIFLHRSRPATSVFNASSHAAHPVIAESIEVLSPTALAELENAAKVNYKALLAQSNALFQADLANTSKRLSEQVTTLTTMVIEKELGKYHETLDEVTAAASATMSRIQEVLEKQRINVEQKMVEEVMAEKARLLAKFDDHLADVLSAYLVESLGQGVDLGSQITYIVSSLEDNKEALKAELMG